MLQQEFSCYCTHILKYCSLGGGRGMVTFSLYTNMTMNFMELLLVTCDGLHFLHRVDQPSLVCLEKHKKHTVWNPLKNMLKIAKYCTNVSVVLVTNSQNKFLVIHLLQNCRRMHAREIMGLVMWREPMQWLQVKSQVSGMIGWMKENSLITVSWARGMILTLQQERMGQ